MNAWPALPIWIAAACVAILFAHAALAKSSDLDLFEQHLGAYRVPPALLPLLRWAVPAAEAAIAALLLSPMRSLGALIAAALLAAYGAAMAWHLAHGRRLDCGCGGPSLPVSWALVIRNAALVGVALVAASPMSLPTHELGFAGFAVIAAAVLLATLLYAAIHQVLLHPVPVRHHHGSLEKP